MTVRDLLSRVREDPESLSVDEKRVLVAWAIEADSVASLPWATDWPMPTITSLECK